MPPKSIILGVIAIELTYLWQVILHELIFFALGVGRTYNHIEDYPYMCRCLRHPLLESCEDMVLDSDGRTLYAACSTSLGRCGWSPGGNRYNLSAREMTDHVSVVNIDESGDDGLYGLRQLEISGAYKGANGDKVIDVLGLEIEPLTSGGLRFWIVNNPPPVGEDGKDMDPKKVGANSTIEAFNLGKGSSELDHAKTFHSDAIATPNSNAATGDGGFYFTNDHAHDKTSIVSRHIMESIWKVSNNCRWREIAFIYGSGSVGYCNSKGACKIPYPKGAFSNGIVKGHDGLHYVSQASKFRVTVLSPQEDGTLVKIDEIVVGMAIDNLSIDTNGNMFGVAFPKPLQLIKSIEDPVNVVCASTGFRIRRYFNADGNLEHEIAKVLEDIDAKVLPCSTVAAHDAKTGNLFLGSVTSPFITVCEKKF